MDKFIYTLQHMSTPYFCCNLYTAATATTAIEFHKLIIVFRRIEKIGIIIVAHCQ